MIIKIRLILKMPKKDIATYRNTITTISKYTPIIFVYKLLNFCILIIELTGKLKTFSGKTL